LIHFFPLAFPDDEAVRQRHRAPALREP